MCLGSIPRRKIGSDSPLMPGWNGSIALSTFPSRGLGVIRRPGLTGLSTSRWLQAGRGPAARPGLRRARRPDPRKRHRPWDARRRPSLGRRVVGTPGASERAPTQGRSREAARPPGQAVPGARPALPVPDARPWAGAGARRSVGRGALARPGAARSGPCRSDRRRTRRCSLEVSFPRAQTVPQAPAPASQRPGVATRVLASRRWRRRGWPPRGHQHRGWPVLGLPQEPGLRPVRAFPVAGVNCLDASDAARYE